jgi:hypothetical protein
MTLEQLRRHHQAQPFQPFDIHLADGRTLAVPHPELLAIVPPGRTCLVAQDNGDVETVDLLLVTTLTKHGNGQGTRRRKT